MLGILAMISVEPECDGYNCCGKTVARGDFKTVAGKGFICMKDDSGDGLLTSQCSTRVMRHDIYNSWQIPRIV